MKLTDRNWFKILEKFMNINNNCFNLDVDAVITNEEFAIFQNAGYMGLYGGLDVDDIHTKKQLELGQKILDYMGSTELIANLFRISQTEEKLRKDNVGRII